MVTYQELLMFTAVLVEVITLVIAFMTYFDDKKK